MSTIIKTAVQQQWDIQYIDRAVDSLQLLDGMAGDWNTNRFYCYYYYPQRIQE